MLPLNVKDHMSQTLVQRCRTLRHQQPPIFLHPFIATSLMQQTTCLSYSLKNKNLLPYQIVLVSTVNCKMWLSSHQDTISECDVSYASSVFRTALKIGLHHSHVHQLINITQSSEMTQPFPVFWMKNMYQSR